METTNQKCLEHRLPKIQWDINLCLKSGASSQVLICRQHMHHRSLVSSILSQSVFVLIKTFWLYMVVYQLLARLCQFSILVFMLIQVVKMDQLDPKMYNLMIWSLSASSSLRDKKQRNCRISHNRRIFYGIISCGATTAVRMLLILWNIMA